MDDALHDPATLFVPVYKSQNTFVTQPDGSISGAFWTAADAAPYLEDADSIVCYLGQSDLSFDYTNLPRDQPTRFFLLEISHQPDFQPPPGSFIQQLRKVQTLPVTETLKNDDEAALLGLARGMAVWHRSVTFCASCGSGNLDTYQLGTKRQCKECGARFRPRVDPSILVLVTHGSKGLMGRKGNWPAGRYSTLAGFVEYGETLEEALVREVYEESGVVVQRDGIKFVSSQPWPFPRSMLVGFLAKADPDHIRLGGDDDELEDVRWFEKDEVRHYLENEDSLDPADFHVPGRSSLARAIIKEWINDAA